MNKLRNLSGIILLIVVCCCSAAFGQEKPQPRLVDEYARVPQNDLQNRLDAFFRELNSDSTATGYILLFGTPQARLKQKKRILSYINFTKYDKSRFTFKEKNKSNETTQHWMVPSGADPPRI